MVWFSFLLGRHSSNSNPHLDILVQIRFIWSLQDHKPHKGSKASSLMCPNISPVSMDWGRRTSHHNIYNNDPSPKKALIFCCADTISAETLAQGACWELLDVANKEGSGSPRVIFPALICIDFKQSGMSGKQSWPDFEEQADEHLRVFSARWASKLLHYCFRSKLIPLLIRPKLDESRQGLAFVFLCAAEHYDELIWKFVCSHIFFYLYP